MAARSAALNVPFAVVFVMTSAPSPAPLAEKSTDRFSMKDLFVSATASAVPASSVTAEQPSVPTGVTMPPPTKEIVPFSPDTSEMPGVIVMLCQAVSIVPPFAPTSTGTEAGMSVPAALAASVPPFRTILPEPDEPMFFAVNVPPLRTNVPEVPLTLPI